MIDCVAESGAQFVKFQIFIPQERATEDHPEWQLFNDWTLSEDDWKHAAQYARRKKLTILADIFGNTSFDICERIGVSGYKIHSEDLLNTHFIAKVASTNKLILINIFCGLWWWLVGFKNATAI